MQQSTIVYSVFLSACALVGVGLFATAPNAPRQPGGDDALTALLGGGPSSDEGTSETGYRSPLDDRRFLDAGMEGVRIDEEEYDQRVNGEEPDILEPADANNPVDPMTGEPYSNRVMESFAQLRETFPDNDLIPRRMTPQERAEREQRNNEILALNTLIAQGSASAEQINEYYDHQMKSYADRQELLDYVERRRDQMSPEVLEQYEKVRTMNEQQTEVLQQQRQRALQRIGASSP